MANELQTTLNEILADKKTNLKPENLKKGITLLGVQGTLENNSSVRLFHTVKEMNTSTGNAENDLAIVYRSDIKSVSNGDTITSITFPKTVVFTEAITSSYNGRLRNNSEPIIYLDIRLDASRFRLRDMENTIPEIEYSSTDGITYTRTDTNEDTYEIGETTVKNLDEHIRQFIQTGGNVFEGLFQYTNKNTGYLYGYKPSQITVDTLNKKLILDNVDDVSVPISTMSLIYDKIYTTHSHWFSGGWMYNPEDNTIHIIILTENDIPQDYGYTRSFMNKNNTWYQAIASKTPSSTQIIKEYVYDITNDSLTSSNFTGETLVDSNYTWFKPYEDMYFLGNNGYNGSEFKLRKMSVKYYNTDSTAISLDDFVQKNNEKWLYKNASTQLTALTGNVYNSTFMGKNGIETGTLTVDVSNSFADTNAKLYNDIQNIYSNMEPRVLTDSDKTIDKSIYFIPTNNKGEVLLDTSNVTNMSQMFRACKNIKDVPLLNTSNTTDLTMTFFECSNLKRISLLDTSKVTSLFDTFGGCTNLVDVPLLDTSNNTSFFDTFEKCTSLSEESLNNILMMCTNAAKITSDKTLKYLGLTSAQANKCKTLSNYSAFTAAGWTTGY